jgi:hypothetical protein
LITITEQIGAIFEQALEIAKKKNSDYASEEDPLLNLMLCERLGVSSAETGVLVRMTDKFQRLVNLQSRDPKVSDESSEDTALDLINYLAILIVLRRRRSHETTT